MSVILWDIDGVLNPFYSTTLVEDGFTHIVEGWASWDVHVERYGAWLRSLERVATQVWCSSWENDSNLLSGHLGLPEWGWVPLDQMNFSDEPVSWKLPSVMDWVNEHAAGEKVVWVDDELEQDAFVWAGNSGGRIMVVKTNPRYGVTGEQYNEIIDFVVD